MKKVFTSLFLLMLGVMATYATDYGLKIAGVNVTSTGYVSAGQSGTIYWDGSKLIFTNVSLTTADNVVYYSGTSAITLQFQGNNTVTSTGTTVLFSYHASMTIQGRLNTGDRLTVRYTGSETGKLGVYVRDGKNLNIYDLYMTVSGKNSGLVAETGDGFASKLSVVTAVLDINSTGGSAAIRGFSSASFDSSDAYMTDGCYYDTTNKRSANSDGTVATGIETDAPLFVGGAIVGIGYSGDKDITPAGVTEGTIKYNHTSKTLTFNAVKMTTEISGDLYNVVWNKNLDGLTIQFNGNNTLALSSNSNGSVLKTEKKMTIKGEGVDLGKLTTLSGNIGIYAPNGEVIIDNASVFANGNHGVCGENSKTLNLTVKNAFLAAKGTSGSIHNVENCVLTGVQSAIDIAPGVCYHKNLKGFGTATELYKDIIWILPWSEDYNVSVLGTKVTDLNREGIAVDGLTAGSIVFDKDSKTLTLDGVKMTGPEEVSGSEVYAIAGSGIEKIVFNGENTITNDGNCFYLTNNVTMEGTGKIIATSNKHSGIYNGTSLNININNTAKFFGKMNGIWGDVGNLTLTKAGSNSDYYFKGTDVAAVRAKSLTLTDMDYWSGSDGTPGCYFDNVYVRQNGGAEVKGDNVVNFYKLDDSDHYGIVIANVELTRHSRFGLGSKYITAGGPQAVTFDSNGNIALNNVTIDTGDAYCSIVTNASKFDNLTFTIYGDCELKQPSGWMNTIFTKNTTIKGDGNLTIGYDLSVFGDMTLTLDNVNINTTTIDGSSSNPSNLVVKLTTPGKRIRTNRVKYFKSLELQNGTLILEPEGAHFDAAQQCVVNASGTQATGIVFADASATGIEGVIMNADAEVTDVFDAEGRQLNEMQPGVNIVRMSDGTTKKIIKK